MSVFGFFSTVPSMLFLKSKKRLYEMHKLISGTDNMLFTGTDNKLMRGR